MGNFKYSSNNSTPSTQSWLSKVPISNQLIDKESNPAADISAFIQNTKLYNKAEPGITHPITTSTIKLRDNGCIDIFTGTNQGIRIDPNTKTLNVICTTEKHHVTEMLAWAEGTIIFNCHRKFEVNSDSDINLNSKKNWNVNIIGDANINVNGTMNISAGALKLNSKGTMVFDAPKYDFK